MTAPKSNKDMSLQSMENSPECYFEYITRQSKSCWAILGRIAAGSLWIILCVNFFLRSNLAPFMKIPRFYDESILFFTLFLQIVILLVLVSVPTIIALRLFGFLYDPFFIARITEDEVFLYFYRIYNPAAGRYRVTFAINEIKDIRDHKKMTSQERERIIKTNADGCPY